MQWKWTEFLKAVTITATFRTNSFHSPFEITFATCPVTVLIELLHLLNTFLAFNCRLPETWVIGISYDGRNPVKNTANEQLSCNECLEHFQVCYLSGRKMVCSFMLRGSLSLNHWMSSTGVPDVRHVSLAVSPSRTASTRGVNLALILPANDNRINIHFIVICTVL